MNNTSAASRGVHTKLVHFFADVHSYGIQQPHTCRKHAIQTMNTQTSTNSQIDAADTSGLLTAALDLAHELAETAGAIARRHFRTRLDVALKADDSPVTIADKGIEAALRARLAQAFPTHGILGEEQGSEHLEADYVWVIDPIDGTKSFITGSPLWGTLLALLHHGRPVLGMIDAPFTRERWLASGSAAAQCNDQPIRTSGCTQLAQARIYTTSPDAFSAADWLRYDALSKRAALRRFGGDCYSYGQLASGHVDLIVESSLQPYDYLALVRIIENAGGVITDWQGRALGIKSDGRVIAAATPALHAEALAQLGG